MMTNKRAAWISIFCITGILWLWHYGHVTGCKDVAIYVKCRNYFD